MADRYQQYRWLPELKKHGIAERTARENMVRIPTKPAMHSNLKPAAIPN